MKIIYDTTKHTIRNNDYETKCGLQELDFYVPKGFSKDLFLVLQNSETNSFEVIKIEKKSFDNNKYFIYSVPAAKINSKAGNYHLQLLCFDNQIPSFTNSLSLDLVFDKFKYTSDIYFIHSASQKVADVYDKIVKMTELNLDILNKIRGEVE